MHSLSYEKLEVVFLYKPFDVNLHRQELTQSHLCIRESEINIEFRARWSHNEKIKIYIATPEQFLENILAIKNHFKNVSDDALYGFIIVDEINNPSTILLNKKINRYRNKYKILSEIKYPYSKNQLLNEIRMTVQHIYLISNEEVFENLLTLREIESQAINDISKEMITGNTASSESLIQLILKKSMEISSSDGGFVVLKDNIFSSKKSDNKDNLKNKKYTYSLQSKILLSQNVSLLNEFLDPDQSQITDYLINNGCGISWHEGDKSVTTRGKDKFFLQDSPKFKYDKRTYKIKSYCAFPIRKPGADVDGFIILFNKKLSKKLVLDTLIDIDNNVIGFSLHELNLLESLANQAGISLGHARLINDLRNAFESFTAASITAIESRDPSTKGHSERVATLTVGLAEALNKTNSGIYTLVNFSKLQIEEIRYASLLHDFGKIGVRENVLQKEKKLFPHQFERIESRLSNLKDKIHISILEKYIEKLMKKNEPPTKENLEKYQKEIIKVSQELDNFLKMITDLNEPSVVNIEFLEKITEIAAMKVAIGNTFVPILTPEEIDILSIKRGSLSIQERLEIESHVTHSFNFLVQIPWTQELKNIPEIVFGHHERLDGSGYPRKLLSNDIPLQAKMMAITDIFDALVAQDRPYKKAIPTERAFNILESEVKAGKLDADLFKIFIESKVWNLIKRIDSDHKAA